MTKYEFHTALLCLALIVAGVLGYQLVNGDDGESAGYWTDFFSQTEVLEHRHDSQIEILLPVRHDYKTGHNKSTLRDRSRFQELMTGEEYLIEPVDEESEPKDVESAAVDENSDEAARNRSDG